MERINIVDEDNEFERVDKIVEKLNEIIDWINTQYSVFYIDRNQVKRIDYACK